MIAEALWLAVTNDETGLQFTVPVFEGFSLNLGDACVFVANPNGVSYVMATKDGPAAERLLFDSPHRFGALTVRVYRAKTEAEENLAHPRVLDPTLNM